jgi:5,10-methenyltetrahydromethanopterin hydrogenase
LPAASRATALIVCAPSLAPVVFQAIEYGALVSGGPASTPSRRNWTLVTPTLSEALALTVIVPDTVAPFAGEVMLAEGAVVSGGGAFETVTPIVAEVRVLPAASRATALIVCAPSATVLVSHGIEYGALVSSARTTPSSRKRTPTTPTLSEALAVTLIVPDTVAPFAGAVMLTEGAVTSLNTVTVTPLEFQRTPRTS